MKDHTDEDIDFNGPWCMILTGVILVELGTIRLLWYIL